MDRQIETPGNKVAHQLRAFREQIRRMWTWWLFSAIALLGVGILAPQQIEVVLYKVCLVTIAMLLSYRADSVLYRYAPPIAVDMPRDNVSAARLIARAMITLAVVIGITVGI